MTADKTSGAGGEIEPFELIDTHCHLDFDAFQADRAEVIRRAVEGGIRYLVVPAVDLDNAGLVLDLAERFEPVYAAVGIHPTSTAPWQEEWIDIIHGLAIRQKVVAIGEIGLDYYWEKSPSETQHRAFTGQLGLAAQLGLPVIIHNRDAGDDIIRLLALSPLAGTDHPGVLHSFSADWVTARAALDLGFYLGFTGPLTYKKADELREVAKRAPLDRIVIETDAPFLPPQLFRGRRNEPAYVRAVAERLAELRGLSFSEIAQVTTENAARLFHLPHAIRTG